MNQIILFLIVSVLLLSSLIAGCFIYFSNQPTYSIVSTSKAVVTPRVENNGQQADLQSISNNIHNFWFNPTQIKVKVGSTIAWKNDDSMPHQIKSSSFESKVLTPGETYTYTFEKPGTYRYTCALNPQNQGEIIVTESLLDFLRRLW